MTIVVITTKPMGMSTVSRLKGLFADSSFIRRGQVERLIVNTITEAKAHFSAFIEKVVSGEEIIIRKAGKSATRR